MLFLTPTVSIKIDTLLCFFNNKFFGFLKDIIFNDNYPIRIKPIICIF